MDSEIYLKLTVLGAVLIIALAYPAVSAFALTGFAAWHLRKTRIGDVALVQKITGLTPPGLKAIFSEKVDHIRLIGR